MEDVFDEGAGHIGRGLHKKRKIYFFAIFLTIQNHSWTPKTCFAYGLDCLLFIWGIFKGLYYSVAI